MNALKAARSHFRNFQERTREPGLTALLMIEVSLIFIAMPLAGMLIIALGFKKLPGRSAGWIGTVAIAASFIFALDALIKLQALAPSHRALGSTLWSIANTVGVNANATLLVDPLSVFMICVVAGVSTLIHLYSISYMKGDRGYVRRADGTMVEFRVTAVRTYLKDEFPTEIVFGPTANAQLRLITCGGAFDFATGHYLSNTVVYTTEIS